jgi:uncharacterized protein (DUF169 family)
MIGVLFVMGRERCVASLREKEVDTAVGGRIRTCRKGTNLVGAESCTACCETVEDVAKVREPAGRLVQSILEQGVRMCGCADLTTACRQNNSYCCPSESRAGQTAACNVTNLAFQSFRHKCVYLPLSRYVFCPSHPVILWAS